MLRSWNRPILLILVSWLLAAPQLVAATVDVTVSNNVFSPSTVNIQAGDTVRWTKAGTGFHNVNADGGGFRSGDLTTAQFVFSHTFASAGSFRYYCEAHGGPSGLGMSGMVVVAASDPPGTLALGASAASVGEAGGQLSLTLTRTGGDDGAVSVDVVTADGTATAGLDYTATTTTVQWADNDDDPKMVTIPILEDLLDEADETFTVSLGNPGGGASLGATTQATVTIVDNDEPPSACIPDATTLCLNGGRFQVRVSWVTTQGAAGVGAAIEIGRDDSGLFSFFNPDNVELLVKVLDACGGFGHYWVFISSATNQEWHLTVVDTQEGVSKTYDNPLRNFPPLIADTTAFATCP